MVLFLPPSWLEANSRAMGAPQPISNAGGREGGREGAWGNLQRIYCTAHFHCDFSRSLPMTESKLFVCILFAFPFMGALTV